jgi:hypothetical protein
VGENHLIWFSDFRSEMQVWRCSQTKCRNPRSGVQLATWRGADNGLAPCDALLVDGRSMGQLAKNLKIELGLDERITIGLAHLWEDNWPGHRH